jgi:hypothetical protein
MTDTPDYRLQLFLAFDQAVAVADAVNSTQLRDPTSCSAMDVGALLDHLVFAAQRASGLGRGEAPATDDAHVPHVELASATGITDILDEQLGEDTLACAKLTIRSDYRNVEGNPFGPEVEPPIEATSWERLAAFMGRTPRVFR